MLVVAGGVVAASGLLAACGGGAAGPDGTVSQYLAAWGHQDYRAMERLVDKPPADFVSFNRRVASDLRLTTAAYDKGAVTTNGSGATAVVTSHLVLGTIGSLTVHSTLHLSDASGSWRVLWSPRSIIPSLGPGDSVATTVTWPARAAVLGSGGAPLTTDAPMVSVGIEGSRVTDGNALTAALLQTGATAGQIQAAQLTALAHPTWFVPVISLTQARYEQLKPVIYPVPGTVFTTFGARSPLTPELGAHVVGAVGPVTAQEIQQLGPVYSAGDTVGQTGIEQAYEHQLAGTPGATVAVTDHAGTTVATLKRFPDHPGTALQTTIDPAIQQAAESALTGETFPADLVAIQASTGDVLASVSIPDSQQANDAFIGAYPPGSTFKVVTSADLLEHGSTPASPASCPPTITVNGEVFHNFEGETTSSLSLLQAFAMSCNTAFIGLSSSLPDASYATTASQFGIGAAVKMGLSAFGGKVPMPTSPSDAAATAIGQAQVTVSPLAMADVAASVDAGSLHPPRLVAGAADDTVPAQALDPNVVSSLRTMMQAVVTSSIGTAAGAGLPAGTLGKTGTAEFGNANPPQTDAWFIGYRGDLAFAVLVVGGGVGGAVAAPIATKFLNAVGSAPLP
ncbi:MAG TPA: penicillin-binding transpeptidase domain-containing protein [Acidimicrobiales bacterium]|nr:penicillin-binding transpeptidase domain-containing protein [Acidimicrobiales bacterium]